MKILLCSDACPQSTSYYWERALRAEGHELVTLGPLFSREDAEDWQQAEEQANEFKGAGRFHRWRMLKTLPQHRDIETEPSGDPVRLSGDGGCELILWIDAGLHRLALDVSAVTVPTVALVGDLHSEAQLEDQLCHARQFDSVYLQFKPWAEKLFADKGLKARWLPPCADPEIHGYGADVEPVYDVGLIGSTNPQWHGRRVEALRAMEKAGIDVKVESAMHEEAALFHRRCRVLFNYSMTDDLNMRVPETMITGRPLVTDSVQGLTVFGLPGETHIRYMSAESIIGYVKALLADSDVATRIGRAGRDLILAQHTYRQRVRELLGEPAIDDEKLCPECGELWSDE